MGFGIALGGVAKGLESAEGAQATKRALDLRAQDLASTQDYQNRALGIRQKSLQQDQQNKLLGQADKIIADHTKIIMETIKHAQAAGNSPDQIKAAVAPLLADVESLGQASGRDTTAVSDQVNAILTLPAPAPGSKIGGTLEDIKGKISRGETLTPGQQKIYDDAQKMSLFDRMLLGQNPEGDTAAPAAPAAAPAAAAPAAPTAATVPHVPAALSGKGALWSPSKQRFYLPDGTSFNQQGVPVS